MSDDLIICFTDGHSSMHSWDTSWSYLRMTDEALRRSGIHSIYRWSPMLQDYVEARHVPHEHDDPAPYTDPIDPPADPEHQGRGQDRSEELLIFYHSGVVCFAAASRVHQYLGMSDQELRRAGISGLARQDPEIDYYRSVRHVPTADERYA